MLHPCCFIYQIDVRLLLLLGIVVYVRFRLQGHAVGLGLELLVHLFEGGALGAEVDAFVVLILFIETLSRAWLVRHDPQLLVSIQPTPGAPKIL